MGHFSSQIGVQRDRHLLANLLLLAIRPASTLNVETLNVLTHLTHDAQGDL